MRPVRETAALDWLVRRRLALRELGQAQWAEVYLRERVVRQEALEWDHLSKHLFLAQERV